MLHAQLFHVAKVGLVQIYLFVLLSVFFECWLKYADQSRKKGP